MTIGRRRFLELGAAAALTGCVPPREAPMPRRPDGTGVALGGKVEHLVVLMLENRSFDQMLGALRGPEYDGTPAGVRLAYPGRDGAIQSVALREGAPPDSFSPDPGHNFQAVERQIRSGGPDRPADMAGFAHRFVSDHPSVARADVEAYLTTYADGRLPILQGLAREYGVCSHWFCSLPSSTAPNRMFTHAGTSAGVTRKGAYYSRLRDKLIFDKIGRTDRGFRVYFHDMPHLWLTGDAWFQSFGSRFSFMNGFDRDVRADQLPAYSFIEPRHVVPPWNSQHPAGGVSHGEELIARVYNTLVSNPAVFEKSLLVIVYDEHGGFYDHVIPPGHPGWDAQCPGVRYDVVRPDGAVAIGEGRENGYDFTTLGPRVPAVVISPWIERGSVFGWKARDPARRVTFDHTSILATVGAMTGVWVDSKRAAAASSLAVTLNRTSPRRDYPTHLAFDPAVYRERKVQRAGLPDGEPRLAGVGQELYDAWRETHGDAPPVEMIEHVRRVVEG